MSAKFLDSNGLLYLWSKIKSLVSNKVDKVDGKGLSTNDYTTTEKNKLSGIEAGANKYSHPLDYDRIDTEFYFRKLKFNEYGHLVGTENVTKADITALGIPAQDTTYSAATTSAAGLMSASDKSKLDGIASEANKYSLPTASSSTLGGVKIGSNISISSGTISVANASTSAKGVVQLSNNIDGTSETTAATTKAVTDAYDKGVAAYNLASSKQSPATTLSGYGITDAYTKTEVDSKLTSAVKYKGTKASYSALPTSGNVTGDMWNITAADKTNGIKAGDNVVWNGTGWDVQSGTVDLTGCVQTSDAITNAEIDTIVAS